MAEWIVVFRWYRRCYWLEKQCYNCVDAAGIEFVFRVVQLVIIVMKCLHWGTWSMIFERILGEELRNVGCVRGKRRRIAAMSDAIMGHWRVSVFVVFVVRFS